VAPSVELKDNTPLQKKLKNLSGQFSLFALLGAFLVLIILISMTVIETIYTANDEEGSVWQMLMSKLPQHINLVVVFIVVAIPEGLPMTIGISLAFSVLRMYNDGILIRKLEAPEQLGACDEILCGKTATLT
jgi:Ca2+-transporting ATPase